MRFSIISSYSYWLLPVCIIAGVGYAALLYYKENKSDFSSRVKRVLAVVRTITVSLIAFLLLSPMAESIHRYLEKPIVLLALDNSGSMVVSRDSVQVRKDFTVKFQKLADDLSKHYEVHSYLFGDHVSEATTATFTDKQTDMANLFSTINDKYSNRNLAALVLASDGIYNSGADPLYISDNAPYTIYTIALGDTLHQKDMLILRVNYNRIAYLGNDFPVEITISAHKCAGSKGKVTLSSGNETLYSENLVVPDQDYTRTFTTKISATKPGMQRLRVAVSTVPGEITLTNNFQDIFVEVLDGRQKVLLLHSAPHPDIAALKQAVEKNKNYTIEEFLSADFRGNLSSYNLVILHQIPSINDMAFPVINQLKTSQIPVFYILGSQSNLDAYNALASGLSIAAANTSDNEATPALNKDFGLFSITPEIEKMVSEFPPISVPFGKYKTGTSSQVLLFQRIGNVNTQIPLLVFNQGVDRKSATITGEGIWRWRLTNFLKAGNQQAFDELFSKVIQYLAVKEDKSQFRVFLKNHFYENEAVILDAELYNDSFELVNGPEVNLVVTDENKKNYTYAFTRTSKAYYLNAGSFAPGDYKYKADVTYNGKRFEKNGIFSVAALNVEWMNTVADHNLLSNMAMRHKGKMLHSSQLDQVPELLAARDDLKTIVYSQKRYTDLVSFFPVLLLIIGLLTTEWFIRKRSGSY